MYDLETKTIQCPYCWEEFATTIDRSECEFSEEEQQYTEDCYVCCRPIVFRIRLNQRNQLDVQVSAELDC